MEGIIKRAWHRGCSTIRASRVLSSQSQQQLFLATCVLITVTSAWHWKQQVIGEDCDTYIQVPFLFLLLPVRLVMLQLAQAEELSLLLPPRTGIPWFPALQPSVFIGWSQVGRGDPPRDRICFQLFITSGAKVSGERPGSFVLLMAQTVSSVTGTGGGRGAFAALEPGNCKANSSEQLSPGSVQQRHLSELRRGTTRLGLESGIRKCDGAAESNR